MGELLALAVHGDAFVHRRANGTMLVDGGGRSATLAIELAAQSPAISKLDVVVCTHADLDHANGLKSILTDWRAAAKAPVTIGEFWLPGRWLEIARTGLQDPKRLMADLTRALDSGVLAITRALLWAEGDDDEGLEDGNEAPLKAVPDFTLRQLIKALDHPDVRLSISAAPAVDGADTVASAEAGRVTAGADKRSIGPTTPPFIDKPDGSGAPSADSPPQPTSDEVRGLNVLLDGIRHAGRTAGQPGEDGTVADPLAGPAEPFEPEWAREMREQEHAPADRDAAAAAFWNARRRVVYRIGRHRHLIERGLPVTVRTSESLGTYCLALIDAAEAIVEIARHAMAEGVPIRWFDHDAYTEHGQPGGGRPNFLLPMNAVELRSPPVVQVPSVVFYLTLSKANRESLVFYAPAEPGCRGVVFSGDSRLGYGWGGSQPFHAYRQMSKAPQVGTAPHHAAESADLAYVHAPLFGIDRWVCAANGRTKPGPSYRALKPGTRCCTACPLLPKALAAVSIDLRLTGFALPGPCNCT